MHGTSVNRQASQGFSRIELLASLALVLLLLLAAVFFWMPDQPSEPPAAPQIPAVVPEPLPEPDPPAIPPAPAETTAAEIVPPAVPQPQLEPEPIVQPPVPAAPLILRTQPEPEPKPEVTEGLQQPVVAAIPQEPTPVTVAPVVAAAPVTDTVDSESNTDQPDADRVVPEMLRLLKAGEAQQAYDLGMQHLPELAGEPRFDMALGIAAERSGHPEQAVFAFERVLMHYPDENLAHLAMARAYLQLGNLVAARHHLNRALAGQPSPGVAQSAQWHLAVLNNLERGRSLAFGEAEWHWHLGARLGYDGNVRSSTDSEVRWFNWVMDMPDPDKDGFYEVFAGVQRYQQLSRRWGWFAGADLGWRGYHSETEMNRLQLAGQLGALLLGSQWRLSLPLQVQKMQRRDDEETLLYSMGAEYTWRLDERLDWSTFARAGQLFYELKDERDLNLFSLGSVLSWRPNDDWRLWAGPMLGVDQAQDGDMKHLGRNWYGLISGLEYRLNDRQRIHAGLSYLMSRYREDDAAFLQRREDDQLSLSLNYQYRPRTDWLLAFSLQQQFNDSALNLYDYDRTQLSVEVRKEW